MDNYDGSKYIRIPITGWGNKQLVTLQLLKNYVNNEDYLYNECENLWDSTPPITRKLFKPLPMDADKSYGVSLNSDDEYTMYDKTDTTVLINFTSTVNPENDNYYQKMIDTVKTTCVYDNNVITLPKKTVSVLDTNTRDYSPFDNDMTCNEFWYIGYDRNRVYETRPNWVMNEEHGGIPAICRAQTFKVDLNDKTLPYGVLESVVLNLHGESLQTGVPLIVEITEAVEQNGTYYPASRDHINNDRYNTTKYGDGKRAKQIAKQYWYPSNTDPGVVAITFDWGAKVEDNKHYAIVLRSPLNHQPNPYSIGGWNKHCNGDVYKDGDAFMSTNNGYTWLKYGKDSNVGYHEGMYAPQDFAFQCHIRQEHEEYETGEYTIYTKPIHIEGIESITISCEDESRDGTINYYAYNPLTEDWVLFNEYNTVTFKDEQRPDVTIIKAVLSLTRTGNAPYIQTMNIHVHHQLFKKGMLRTLPYTPRTTGILSASTYSHVHCPYKVADRQKDIITVDIIQESINYTHADIIELTSIPRYDSICKSVTPSVKDEINEIINANETRKETLIKTFIEAHTQLFTDLEACNVYVLENPNLKSIRIDGNSAYPIIRCSLQPVSGETIEFTEWLDYTVNYDETDNKTDKETDNKTNNNLITFNKTSLKKLCTGHITISYNPVFAKNIPTTVYDDYNVSDLDLSLIHETHIILEKDLAEPIVSYTTLTEALNPLREVKRVRKDTTDQILVEGEDYNVDYNKKTIQLHTEDFLADDEISIKYTPYLTNDSISLCYHLKRENNEQLTIQGNYIDYKT